MSRGRKAAHVDPGLSQDLLGCSLADTRDLVEERQSRPERAHTVARIASKPRRRWVVGLSAAGALLEIAVLLVILLPLVPPSSMHRVGLDKLNPDMANTVGWPEFTAQVGAVYNSLPPEQRARTAILTRIDGQAGAIDIYGGSEHLPQAISPHLNFWYWKPANLDATTLVVVGYRPSQVAFLCGSVTSAGAVRIPYSIDNLNQARQSSSAPTCASPSTRLGRRSGISAEADPARPEVRLDPIGPLFQAAGGLPGGLPAPRRFPPQLSSSRTTAEEAVPQPARGVASFAGSQVERTSPSGHSRPRG